MLISVDMANAFKSIHRAAMFAAVQQSPPALLLIKQWVYRDETPLHIVGTRHVMSQRGMQQDDPTLCFCCCVHLRCSVWWSHLIQCARGHRLCPTWTT